VRGRAAAVLGVVVVLTMLLATSASGDAPVPSAPEITAHPPVFSNSPDAVFAFESPEDVVFECRLDSAAPEDFVTCSESNSATKGYIGLAEGQHTFDVVAVNKSDSRSGVTSFTWTIDLVPPPAPTITADPPEEVTTSPSVTFSFASEGAESFICILDGVSSACGASNTYSGLAEGLHTLDVIAKDAAGNESFPSRRTWTVDLSPPNPTVTSPAAGSATSDQTPLLLGTADAGPADENVVTVELYAGSAATGTPLKTFTPSVTEGGWSVVPSSQLAAGTYTVQVIQSDIFDRTGTSSPVTFKVDLTAPKVSLTRPPNGTLTTNPTPIYQGTAGTAEGDLPEATVEVHSGSTASGPLVGAFPGAVAGDGTWSIPQPTPLADGKYAALAKQMDSAGSTGTSSVHVFMVDTTAPSALTSATVRAGYGAVAISWQRGSDWKTTDMLAIYRRVAGASTRRLKVKTTASSWKDKNVKNGVTYQYDLVPIDRAGNRALALSKNARPTGFTRPRNGAVLSAPITISWVDVANSTYSNIQVWNAGLTRKMLSVWPKGTSYTLRTHWTYKGNEYRLRHGRTYRIYGWPGFGAISNGNYGESYGWVEFTFR
jgi:hypothetical protein